ncbi:nuclear transport factor 2 family protein [Idiomarina aminovorans]|uniref:nuclear transport factor 2 family protein n=1 Tax=Idiomarina aminovorans TaxID=2914829 RepID=UPI00200476EA|nr:nuclear transport factor 2 family protein [Idiomarina sp. ATCH4]MCK7460215.1 nuclear transport factor 2 family protein [Idiomarina sp. ATCH4]
MKYCHVLFASLLLSNVAFASDLTAKVNQYFEAQEAVEHKNSTKNDVSNLLALLTEDATFEHPKFNAVQSKSEYRKGLLSYLGKYGECDIQVKNVIEGLNAVTVEYLHPCVDKNGSSDPEGNKQKLVTLFEFKNNKIKLIRHYF